MGIRGPVPKPAARSRSHRHPEAAAGGTRELDEPLGPPAPGWLSPYGQWWYDQFRYSGQAAYYTPSDWAVLTMLADMAQHLHKKPSAVMLASILHGCTGLGATEGDRRRIQMELEGASAADPDEMHAVAQMDAYRNRLHAAP